jgi:hypothetical protein
MTGVRPYCLLAGHVACVTWRRIIMRISRHLAWLAGSLAMMGVGATDHPAWAMSSCTGEYSTAVFHPLPVPTVVTLNLRNRADPSAARARAFLNGIRDAGVQVSGEPTVSLTVTYQILGEGSASSPAANAPMAIGPGASGWGSQWGNSQNWLTGGWQGALPDLPRQGLLQPRPQAQPALLVLRVEADNIQTKATNWIGMVQCTMQTSDDKALAYDIGRLVGGSLGKRVSRGPM